MAVECPRKLYYAGKKNVYRDNKQEDTFLKALADGGFQVGELAKCLYPDGIEVYSKGNADALAETAELLKRESVTLFEPAIAYGAYLVRVDVLIKAGNSIKLVEVKAKSIKSDDHQIEGRGGLKSAFKPYIEDIAFQKYIVGLAYPECPITSYLLMPDKTQTAVIDKMNQLFKVKQIGAESEVITDPATKDLTFDQSLLHEFNVDHYIDLVHEHGLNFPHATGSMEELAAVWAKAYAEDIAIPAPIGAQCASCEFKAAPNDKLRSGFHECWKEANNWSDDDFTAPTLLDLWNYRGKQKLMGAGIRRLSEVTQEDLKYAASDDGLSNSERQWMQVQWSTNDVSEELKSAGFFIDHEYMTKEMDRWRFPLHFIDFETSTSALPFHIGMNPYESVAFQFSHHTLEKDGSLKHANQFLLAEAGQFPNYEFARALQAALSENNGSVFMWSSHENTILSHIITQLNTRSDAPEDKTELIAFLETLTKEGDRAMVDLKIIAQKGYFHPSTNGSNSIKKVLPAVLESSAFLRERYSKPIYGADDGIPSSNFRNMTWWKEDAQGFVQDPYDALKDSEVTDQSAAAIDSDDLEIAGGGEASMAYGRLQFEALPAETQKSIKDKLLRYCELDTLAMAMIVEAWKAESGKKPFADGIA
ncbi:MAG: hypothetical protein CFE36_08290 [Sphingomonadaceae bacterium PASS1]|nr:MAG: hypothetical protein CFE36_08290 [Sphingomonadaceae bacterium PASS1]